MPAFSWKWDERVVGSVQTGLGLTVNTNKLTVGFSPEYRRQVRDLLISAWSSSRRIFKVADTQKLIGKMAWWIYKIMSHIYTSLAFALKQNKLLLLKCSAIWWKPIWDCQGAKFCLKNCGKARQWPQADLHYQRDNESRIRLYPASLEGWLGDFFWSAHCLHDSKDPNGIFVWGQLSPFLWRILHWPSSLVVFAIPRQNSSANFASSQK